MPDDTRAGRQFVKFGFYKLRSDWHQLDAARQRRGKLEFLAALTDVRRRMLVKPYSLVGLRGDCDLLLWQVSVDPDAFQVLATALRCTDLGGYLETPYSYFSQTRRSIYEIPGEEDGDLERLVIDPGERRYLFVYPFVKSRAWYALDHVERQRLMNEHIEVGRRYPDVRLNTTYSYGLDDQEFVVAFESDDPGEFLDLIMDLRETEASQYTARDTPIFSCRACTAREMIDSLGGAEIGGDEPETDADGWVQVAELLDVPADGAHLAFAGSRQIALFNVADEIYAVENRCPHSRGPLCHGRLAAANAGTDGHPTITCPWHQATFDLVTGSVLPDGVTDKPVTVFPVKIDDDGGIRIRIQTKV